MLLCSEQVTVVNTWRIRFLLLCHVGTIQTLKEVATETLLWTHWLECPCFYPALNEFFFSVHIKLDIQEQLCNLIKLSVCNMEN